MPRMIDLIRASAVPATLVQAASKGALSVPPAEMIEILVHLAIHNKVFGQQARITLAGWDEKASKLAASDPNSPKEVLDYLIAAENLRPVLLPTLLENSSVGEESLTLLAASGSNEVVEAMGKSARVQASPNVLNALRSNPNVAAHEAPPAPLEIETFAPEDSGAPDPELEAGLMAYLNEHAQEISTEAAKPFQAIGGVYEETPASEEITAEVPVATPAAETVPAATATVAPATAAAKKKAHPGEEERGSALQKINKLDIKGRIQLAMKGTKEERSLLIRDGTKVVALAVLESPKIGDAEVEKFASQKNVLEAVLRQIPLKRRFMKHYGIVRNLVFNPRTPLDISLGLMKNLLVHDLRNLSGNKEVSETVRKLATKMFKQKADTTKKSTD
jgi:hypothetical protein